MPQAVQRPRRGPALAGLGLSVTLAAAAATAGFLGAGLVGFDRWPAASVPPPGGNVTVRAEPVVRVAPAGGATRQRPAPTRPTTVGPATVPVVTIVPSFTQSGAAGGFGSEPGCACPVASGGRTPGARGSHGSSASVADTVESTGSVLGDGVARLGSKGAGTISQASPELARAVRRAGAGGSAGAEDLSRRAADAIRRLPGH